MYVLVYVYCVLAVKIFIVCSFTIYKSDTLQQDVGGVGGSDYFCIVVPDMS